MKGDTEVVLMILLFFTGAVFASYAKEISLLPFLNTFIMSLTTLLAAYFGAKFAFDFQINKEEQYQINKNRVSGNLAIFKLIAMINSLLSYQRQVIEPVRTKPTAFIEMSPTLPQVKDHISIDIDSLSFLFDAEDPNLIGELSIEEARYEAAIAAINDRSTFHRNEVQPTLDEAGMKSGGYYSHENLQNALGERIFNTLHQSTRQVIDHTDSTILSLNEIAAKLTISLKKQFPNERIISVSIPKDKTKGDATL